MRFTHLTPANYVRMPWKNGLGVTTEIARFPANGDFHWRISAADVATDGPFSKFPGCDRVILTLDGAGMILTHSETAQSIRIGPLEPWAFSGDWDTQCVLIDGAIRDFNVITRRDAFRPAVSVMQIDGHATVAADAAVIALYCVAGAMTVAGSTVEEGETMIGHHDHQTCAVELDATHAIVIAVRLTSVAH